MADPKLTVTIDADTSALDAALSKMERLRDLADEGLMPLELEDDSLSWPEAFIIVGIVAILGILGVVGLVTL